MLLGEESAQGFASLGQSMTLLIPLAHMSAILGQQQAFPAVNYRRLNGWKATVTGRSLL